MIKFPEWFNNETLELEIMNSVPNINNTPSAFNMRAILVDPLTKIRSYQKLILVKFEEVDKLDD